MQFINRVTNKMHITDQQQSRSPSPLVSIALLALSLMATAPAIAAGEHGGGHDEEHGGGHNDEHGGGHDDGGGGHGGGGGHTFSFGAPAEASEADRTIAVTARDNMVFSPDTVSIEKGTTVRFVVENVGQLQHSFTLATPGEQRQHEKEMQGMSMDRMAGHMDEDPNGIVLQPGETGSITWQFTAATTVQFACHIPGHYPAGMKGSIDVNH